MGYPKNMTSSDWSTFKEERKLDTARSYSEIYKSTEVKNEYLARNVLRESRDSELHPNSNALIFGLDSTGSMDRIYTVVAKRLGDLVLNIFEDNIVNDAQIMFAAIDDSFYCDTPLQITQFEVDNKIAEQLMDLKFTRQGGGNSFESYPLLWYFASRHTSIDCYEKRGIKGFMITVGDDGLPDKLLKSEVESVFGDTVQDDVMVSDLLNEINKKYDVYHISLEQGGSFSDRVVRDWKSVLGSHALTLSDYEKLPELIISLLKVHYGESIEKAVGKWDGTTGMVVRESLKGLITTGNDSTGLVTF